MTNSDPSSKIGNQAGEKMNTLDILLDYFKTKYGVNRLSEITWAHAVNSEVEFAACLNDGKTMFIEADVGLTADGVPIMAHPPSNESDLTLEDMLSRLKGSDQGIKLDFKEWGAVEQGLQFLQAMNLPQPILLNADILQGNGAKEPKVPAKNFLQLCQANFPAGILSLGWTTEPEMPYSSANVDEMITTITDLDAVLFPVRASLVQASWNHLQRLMPEDKPGWALSFWNAAAEPPTPEFIDWLKNQAKPARAVYDLMDSQKTPIPISI